MQKTQWHIKIHTHKHTYVCISQITANNKETYIDKQKPNHSMYIHTYISKYIYIYLSIYFSLYIYICYTNTVMTPMSEMLCPPPPKKKEKRKEYILPPFALGFHFKENVWHLSMVKFMGGGGGTHALQKNPKKTSTLSKPKNSGRWTGQQKWVRLTDQKRDQCRQTDRQAGRPTSGKLTQADRLATKRMTQTGRDRGQADRWDRLRKLTQDRQHDRQVNLKTDWLRQADRHTARQVSKKTKTQTGR